jgi:long-chain acyl-CoA synthetase
MSQKYDRVEVPADGSRIEAVGEDDIDVPDDPIVPIIHGDGIGADVGPAAQKVLQAAANATGREINWMRVYAGESARERYGEDVHLPDDTVDAIREFRSFGVNFLQVYGQSEMAGLTATQTDWSNDIRSVGYPVEGLDFRISETGEVLIGTASGERPFPGYYENPEANEGLFTEDGYFKTEDYGHFTEDGELVMIDRMDHLIELDDGSTFSPRFVEDALRYSPFISEAFTIGDGREYITCIVEIDWEHMSWWAEENGVPFTTYADLTEREAVREVVAEEIARVNEDQPENGRIRKFMLFDEMLDHEDQELTQTMKLRRSYLEEKYADWIGAMYGEAETDQPVVDVAGEQPGATAD